MMKIKGFTDEQIIIALESSKEAAETDEIRDFLDDVIECINRKNAEIERLKRIIDEKDKEILGLQKRIIFWREDLNYQPEKIKSEAIKEFAERLKRCIRFDDKCEYNCAKRIVGFINYLVKEMTEVQE